MINLTGNLEEERNRLLIRRTRVLCGFVALGYLAAALVGLALRPGEDTPLHVSQLAIVVVIGLTLYVLSRPFARRFPVPVVFSATAFCLCIVTAQATLVAEEADLLAVLSLVLSTTVIAALLPWGTKPQLGLVALAAILAPAQRYWLHGTLAGTGFLGVIPFVFALALSVYIAHVLERSRTTLARQRRKLTESERKYRDLAENSKDVIWIWTRDKLDYVSPAYEKLTGYSRAPLFENPMAFLRTAHPEDRERMTEAIRKIRAGESAVMDGRFRRQDGEIVWVEGWGVPICSEEETPSRFIGMWRDITQRKRIEEEKTALLEVAEEITGELDLDKILGSVLRRMTALIPCNAAIVFAWDSEHKAHRALAQYGVNPERVADVMSLEIPEDSAIVRGLAERETLLANDIADQEYLPRELLADFHVTAMAGTPLLVREGDLVGSCFIFNTWEPRRFEAAEVQLFQGMAHHLALALETARLFEDLARANRVKEHFVATLSHELRNTITSIGGYQTLLLDEVAGALNAEQRDILEHADKCARELNGLITATLDLSRFEANKVPLDICEVSVPQLIEELSYELRLPKEKGDVELVWNVDASLPRLRTDPLKLKMVLRNLLTNAVKFTDRGSVTLTAAPAEDGMEFRVTDTGIGIAEDALKTLFEPFQQAHGVLSRKKGGAGLGLYIVQRLVELLRGRIEVESEVGRGSTFEVWLPLTINGSREYRRRVPDRQDHAAPPI